MFLALPPNQKKSAEKYARFQAYTQNTLGKILIGALEDGEKPQKYDNEH